VKVEFKVATLLQHAVVTIERTELAMMMEELKELIHCHPDSQILKRLHDRIENQFIQHQELRNVSL